MLHNHSLLKTPKTYQLYKNILVLVYHVNQWLQCPTLSSLTQATSN